MRILVTGGAGYVGSFAVRALLDVGHEITVLDDLSRGHRNAVPLDLLVEGGVADRALVGRLLSERRIDLVMHFAASSLLGESVRAPLAYWRNNVAASLALLETMMEGDVRQIVFSSSCSVYGEKDEPLHEDLAPAPESPYAFTKLAIERMIQDAARAYGLGHVLLRYFNAAGASDDGAHGEDHEPETHLIPLVLQTALGLRPGLEVYGGDYPTPDGTCIRDYVHVEDLARAHALAARACPAPDDSRPGRVLNVGTGRGHSVLDVIHAAERVTGKRVTRQLVARRPGDAPRLVAAAERIESELGWKPERTGLDGIVESAWRWHRSHPAGYES